MGVAARSRATVKLNIMPLCMCSAMWQCAIHRPGLVTSNRMSTVCPVRTSTVSFQTRFGSATPSRASTRKRPAPCRWNGWCIGWSESISLTSRILTRSPDGELPVDGGAVGAGGPVQQLPAHGRGGGQPVHLDHVVFPLDARRPAGPWPCVRRGRGRQRARLCSFHRRGISRAAGLGTVCGREQLHAALRAAARLVAGHLRMHRAGVAGRRRRWVASSFMPHFGQRPGSSLVTSGCIGQA